jgi:transposase-like protein
VLTGLRNRGVSEVFVVVCDRLDGLPASVYAAFPRALVHPCIMYLVCNTFRYASRSTPDKISSNLKPIYTPSPKAPTAAGPP